MISNYGRYMPWFVFAGICTVCGSALLYTIDAGTPLPSIYGYSILLGVGAGTAMQLPFSISQAKVKPEELALANGLIAQAQVGGLCLSLAISNAIFLNKALAHVSRIMPQAPPAEVQSLISGTSSDQFKALPPRQHDLVLNAVIEAMRNVYLIVVAYGCLNTLSALFLKREKLSTGGSALSQPDEEGSTKSYSVEVTGMSGEKSSS